MSATITVSTELSTINCGVCGGTYAINERYREQAQQKARQWHCPYCQCNWGYQETEEARLKKIISEKENETQRLRQINDQIARDWRNENSLRMEVEKNLRKEQKRTRNGVCPECNRTFPNLAEHMQSCHCGKNAATAQAKSRKKARKAV